MRDELLPGTLRVAASGEYVGESGFLAAARQCPRMLLTGLPGIGKSTALEQAAAAWAADPAAPIPVPVQLRDIERLRPRTEREVTLQVLVDSATRTVESLFLTSSSEALAEGDEVRNV